MTPTKSQANKAGRRLRKMRDGSALVDEKAMQEALSIVNAYRRQHSVPLNRAATLLRSWIESLSIDEARVGQRLKRTPMILRKLDRFPAMALTTMNDIAGCRCVVPSLDDLRRLQERAGLYESATDRDDYVARPKDSGYRGIHVVFAYPDGLVEVQLRTVPMNDWAQFVEEVDFRYGTSLKTDGKPVEVASWLRAMSELIALDEVGEEPPDALMALYEQERDRAVASLRRRMA